MLEEKIESIKVMMNIMLSMKSIMDRDKRLESIEREVEKFHENFYGTGAVEKLK